MQLNPLPEVPVTTFRENVDRLTEGVGKILLAVSGGPDSLAMLLLAQAAIPDRVSAATVDHGLRPESATEAVYIAEICAQLGLPHSILRPDIPITGSMQASARAARYALLEALAADRGCAWIATAHHADDQLETVLMRVARGSGIDGLSAIRDKRGAIIRPMLGFVKAELVAICAHSGLTPVDDPSNRDSSHDRVAMRQWLASVDHPFDAKRAVATAQSFAESSEALEWMTHQLTSTRIGTGDGQWTLDASALPVALTRRLLLQVLTIIQPGYVPRGPALDRALSVLQGGGQTMLGDVLCKGGALWRFSLAPKRSNRA